MTDPDPTSRRHPKGLYVLFGAEMWERFSFYGMRALLVLYLIDHLGYNRPDALGLYAIYTGLVYLSPLLGGFLADRFLSQRKAIFIGGSLMALGHFAMAFEPLLFVALGLLVLGNGFFKPNISTMVGQLYDPNDDRRDSAYTIFYMGINTGAFLAPVVCGTLGETVGWHWGFAAAGFGMVLGLINFAVFQRWLGTGGYPQDREGKPRTRLMGADIVHIILLTIIGAGIVWVAIAGAPAIARLAPSLGNTLVLAYWLGLSLLLILATRFVTGGRAASTDEGLAVDANETGVKGGFTAEEWQRIAVIFIVAIFSIVFWMGFEQAGGTFTLFAKEKTNRVLPSVMQSALKMTEFPSSWFQIINPLLIVLLAPLPLMVWNALERFGLRVNSAAKMGVGLIILGLGFLVMDYANQMASPEHKVGPHWLVIVYLINSVGELCLSPIGLSLVNKLAPTRISSLMMATWFLCTAIANYLAGTMEHILAKHAPNLNLFTFLVYTSIIPGVVLLLVSPVLKKMSRGRL